MFELKPGIVMPEVGLGVKISSSSTTLFSKMVTKSNSIGPSIGSSNCLEQNKCGLVKES